MEEVVVVMEEVVVVMEGVVSSRTRRGSHLPAWGALLVEGRGWVHTLLNIVHTSLVVFL